MKILLNCICLLLLLTACEFEYSSVSAAQKKAEEVDRLYEKGQYDSALVAINELIEDNDKTAGLYHLRGKIYIALNDAEHAQKDLERALELDSENGEFYLSYSKLLMDLGDYPNAMDAVNESIELNPESSMAFANKGAIILRSNGNVAEGVAATRKAIKLDSKNYVALSNLGYIHMTYENGSMDSAIYYLNNALNHQPDYTSARANRAVYYGKTNQYDLALEDAHQCIKEFPGNAAAYRVITYIHLQEKAYDKAIEYGEAGLSTMLNPDIQVVVNLGMAYFENGDHNKACQTWSLVEFNPTGELAEQMESAGCDR